MAQSSQTDSTEKCILTVHIGSCSLPVGLVPPGVKELDVCGHQPKFSAEAIATVNHLEIYDLERDMLFPETLDKLFIRSYSGKVHLPKVRNIFISVSCKNKVGPGYEHYLYGSSASVSTIKSTDIYDCAPSPETVKAFNRTYNVIKRIPKTAVDPSRGLAPNKGHLIELSTGSNEILAEHIGSIKELRLTSKAPRFSAEAIAGLNTLVISDLNQNMHFPETLKRLFIGGYTGTVPLPKVQNVFIHSHWAHNVNDRVPHYLFHYGLGEIRELGDRRTDDTESLATDSKVSSTIPTDSEIFECVGVQQTGALFGTDISILKRVPKVILVPEPVPVPDLASTPTSGIRTDANAKILEILASQQKAIADLIQLLESTNK